MTRGVRRSDGGPGFLAVAFHRPAIIVAVIVFGFRDVDVVANQAEDIGLALAEEFEGAARGAGGGDAEAHDDEGAGDFWSEAEGVVEEGDGRAVENDVIELFVDILEELVGDFTEKVLGRVLEGGAAGDE